jgi:hypothetical protein
MAGGVYHPVRSMSADAILNVFPIRRKCRARP